MEIKEKITELFYILNDIQQSTDNDRIAILADGMPLTTMEMDSVARGWNNPSKAFTTPPFPTIGDDSI